MICSYLLFFFGYSYYVFIVCVLSLEFNEFLFLSFVLSLVFRCSIFKVRLLPVFRRTAYSIYHNLFYLSSTFLNLFQIFLHLLLSGLCAPLSDSLIILPFNSPNVNGFLIFFSISLCCQEFTQLHRGFCIICTIPEQCAKSPLRKQRTFNTYK